MIPAIGFTLLGVIIGLFAERTSHKEAENHLNDKIRRQVPGSSPIAVYRPT